jgi:hypothetical protein
MSDHVRAEEAVYEGSHKPSALPTADSSRKEVEGEITGVVDISIPKAKVYLHELPEAHDFVEVKRTDLESLLEDYLELQRKVAPISEEKSEKLNSGRRSSIRQKPMGHRSITITPLNQKRRQPLTRKISPIMMMGAEEQIAESTKSYASVVLKNQLLSRRKLADLLMYSTDTALRPLVAEKEILYVVVGTGKNFKFPKFQVYNSKLLPGLPNILKVLKFDGKNGMDICNFFIHRNEGLDYFTPCDYLKECQEGDVERVIKAAQLYASHRL